MHCIGTVLRTPSSGTTRVAGHIMFRDTSEPATSLLPYASPRCSPRCRGLMAKDPGTSGFGRRGGQWFQRSSRRRAGGHPLRSAPTREPAGRRAPKGKASLRSPVAPCRATPPPRGLRPRTLGVPPQTYTPLAVALRRQRTQGPGNPVTGPGTSQGRRSRVGHDRRRRPQPPPRPVVELTGPMSTRHAAARFIAPSYDAHGSAHDGSHSGKQAIGRTRSSGD